MSDSSPAITWPPGFAVLPLDKHGDLYLDHLAPPPETYSTRVGWAVCRIDEDPNGEDPEILYYHWGFLAELTHDVFLKARRKQAADLFATVQKEITTFQQHQQP